METDNLFSLMKKHNIRTIQSLGQNFLKDPNTINKIVDSGDITKDDLVIEVGPGAGSLSKKIASKCGQYVGVEIDKNLIPLLEEYLEDFSNAKIIHEDILKVNIDDLLKDYPEYKTYKVIANLPYYITTAVIMRFLESSRPPDVSILMMQKEVADRIIAGPGTKTYGGISVKVKYYCNTSRVTNVSPNCFVPKPDVTSTVLKFEKNLGQKVIVEDKEFFFKVIKSAFAQRRKKVVNSVANTLYLGISKLSIEEILETLGIDLQIRAERLSIEEFASISNEIYKRHYKNIN